MTLSLDDDEYGDREEKDLTMADESHDADPEKVMHREELKKKLQEALAKLTDKHREIVVLHDIRGLSHSEISTMLGISEGTMRSRLHYAHKQLQSLLSEYLN